MLWSMRSQKIRHDLTTKQQQKSDSLPLFFFPAPGEGGSRPAGCIKPVEITPRAGERDARCSYVTVVVLFLYCHLVCMMAASFSVPYLSRNVLLFSPCWHAGCCRDPTCPGLGTESAGRRLPHRKGKGFLNEQQR